MRWVIVLALLGGSVLFWSTEARSGDKKEEERASVREIKIANLAKFRKPLSEDDVGLLLSLDFKSEEDFAKLSSDPELQKQVKSQVDLKKEQLVLLEWMGHEKDKDDFRLDKEKNTVVLTLKIVKGEKFVHLCQLFAMPRGSTWRIGEK